jgi:hypothetical protein
MESGGVYRALRERCPMLPIRGISDIVGLQRSEQWIGFACTSAAAFARAFLRTRPVPVGASSDTSRPSWPRQRAARVSSRHRSCPAVPLQMRRRPSMTMC